MITRKSCVLVLVESFSLAKNMGKVTRVSVKLILSYFPESILIYSNVFKNGRSNICGKQSLKI